MLRTSPTALATGPGPRGTQLALSASLFDAYFLEGKDIGALAVLAAIASRNGFSEDEAIAILADEQERAITKQQAAGMSRQGISGVPFFVFDRKLAFSGAQSVETMKQVIEKALADQGDQARTDEALTALQDLIQRFPNTEYARDARLKVDLARDHLAGKEMTVGRFYLKQGEYLAAINRFRTVIDKYQTTNHAPEALERLTEAYLALGIVKEAQTAAAVLGYNYPGTGWYRDAYTLLTAENAAPTEDEESWISRAFRSVF